MSNTVPTLEVSVVVPLFNEAESINTLYQALREAMVLTGRTWEVIFIDDGSTDNTYPILRDLHYQDAHVRVLRLRRNFGQTAAMAAGFDAARGSVIVCMDGDLQNDPSDIERLLKTLDDDYDVVSGWRVNRQEGFWLRRLPSRVANWLISKITGVHLHDYGCTLKAYRADVVKELRLYGEMHRFIPALIGGYGARITELPVQHHPRRHGYSKYGLSRTLRVVFDLMTVKFWLSFLTRPLQIFGLLGLATGVTGALICIYLAALKLVWHQGLGQRPLLLLGVLLLVVSVQFIGMGILAEVQIRTYHESSNKPIYTIREALDSTEA
ncbi:MAG: glycosyl transferase [Candidatus Entotheonella gemina]|uniref:Glycosyl transferase n=1 Tax=Candidatus Entotheonella gemina TaxID=1429439 RepID=W4M8D8_9BACT|nr:MAG: glycosyl transferase [Candidatus Entotheonella gemina]